MSTRTYTVSAKTMDQLRDAHDRVICRIDDKAETVEQAVEAVYCDYGDLRFRKLLVAYVIRDRFVVR